ncbi:MAG: fused DSP-PTPase phosphatase/NAD kinase-like protein [Bacteroidia bacterium]
MNRLLLIGILLLSFSLWGQQAQICKVSFRQANWATKINVAGFHNLYKVDEEMYRSEQPTANEMFLLDSMGIKTLINLRQIHTDTKEAKKTAIGLVCIPMSAFTISYTDIVVGMKAIMQAKKPILVHCKYGSDRTGCIIAIYRIIICNWTREEAIKEFREGGFGYHEKSFPNILRLLKTIDIEKLKKDIL